ncbi:DUF3592 domain-containing protein [Luteolibacter soli]|uniref:DUF3592 domain-containing protein n=1 Tax=Luteolibacter soli TaxID=3135280 RepID=A0ABU9AWL8_9BACT
MPRRKRSIGGRRRWEWLYIIPLAFISITLIGTGVFTLPRTIALDRSQSVVTAKVIAEQKRPDSRTGPSYDVKYIFSPAPGLPEIGPSDFLGRSLVWVSLPEAAWNEATTTKTLQVKFDPANPANNAPVANRRGIWDNIGMITLGGLLLLITIFAGRSVPP